MTVVPFAYLAPWLLVTGAWHKPKPDSELLQGKLGLCYSVKREDKLDPGGFASGQLASETEVGTTHLCFQMGGWWEKVIAFIPLHSHTAK